MDRALGIVPAPSQGRDVYTNAMPLWQPLWARGVFGGAVIAQTLLVAQETIPSHFLVHSMHCHFLRPVRKDVTVVYRAERIRDGKSICIREVRAYQSGHCVFSTVVSFVHESVTRRQKMLEHQTPFPAEVFARGPPSAPGKPVDRSLLTSTSQVEDGSHLECVRLPIKARDQSPELQRMRQWVRVRENFRNDDPTHKIHLAALAYITDNYFIGTVSRAHRVTRFDNDKTVDTIVSSSPDTQTTRRKVRDLAREEELEIKSSPGGASGTALAQGHSKIGMMVSLDHTIYFHNQMTVRADDWMFVEMGTPWAGDERGLVMQKVWTKDGVLVATCVQEGLVRLVQEESQSRL